MNQRAAGKNLLRRRYTGTLVPLVSMLLGACGDAAIGAADKSTVRDSAGVQIVESRAPAWDEGDGWRLAETPILEIGMAEGASPYLLDRVVGARRLADGGVVVANAGSQELRFYDVEGRHLHSAGGQGMGPGEYQDIGWMDGYPGDSLLVYDPRARRVSVTSSDGEVGRSLTFGRMETGGAAIPVGAFADGSLLGRVATVVGAGEVSTGMRKSTATYAHFSGADGSLLDSIVTLPGEERHLLVEPTMMMITTPLLAPAPHHALSGDRVFLGHGGSFEIATYTSGGAVQRIIRRSGDPIPVTATELALLIDRRLAREEDEKFNRQLTQILASMPTPEFRPAFAGLLADTEGNLWAQESALPGEPNGWTVLDGDGRMLGTVELPQSFRPLQIGADFVLGVATDDLDVQRVLMYELVK